jgi:hypothetical protein
MKAQVYVKAGELIEHGVWLDYCNYAGINEWAVNEGRMDSDELLLVPVDKLREWGIELTSD